ncbi:hypothetical protein BBBOND_0309990 [Babesia bigemina]|uniref:Uncharacterized protein n=1 Tax=Babesia bigemina TaxID=5866 RepID=A0A061D8Q6_BABBI|nr:hypothetical protein BBBOND_0309990 [Babesia bigemina]CDR97096.1 hypothetical protein BBBOND_0309990 [Babesia bigemina]|eukprot:XP_012769282.1 hypothetical protein BBBOND_0309990 [Babesia bigemina]
MELVRCLVIGANITLPTTLNVSCQLGDLWDVDYENCANKLLSSAAERDAERYLAYEEIADVAAHREAEDAQVEQDDGDDDGNDDGGDGWGAGRKGVEAD